MLLNYVKIFLYIKFMKKKIVKSYKTKTLVLQGLYSFYVSNTEVNTISGFLFEKNNVNKIFFYKFIYLCSNIIKKDKIITLILYQNSQIFFNIGMLESIILKIVIFEIFFYNKTSINIIIADALYLSNKFCTKRSYFIIKSVLNNILISYIMFKFIM